MNTKKLMAALFAFPAFILIVVPESFAGSDFRAIDTARLHSLVVDNAHRMEARQATRFTVIDARPEKEYDKAHILSAISIPEADFGKSKALLPKDRNAFLAVYCSSVKTECRAWAEKAAAAGYANVFIYSEGFTVWKDKKMPVAPIGGRLSLQNQF
ncbi:MAG: rhodanese-like domain-containing protein [Nitrospiraceae bacterium]|nr:rhodanese-like domain-containing protein [Nitrospiraceae bacterium]